MEHEDTNYTMDRLVDDLLVNLFVQALKGATIQPAEVNKVKIGHGNLASPFSAWKRSSSVARAPLGPLGLPLVVHPVLSHRGSIVAQAEAVKKGEVFVVRQPKPIGVQFQQRGDGIYVKGIDPNNADPRVRKGDKLLAVSASFGNEIWNAESLGQTMSALNTRVGPVYMRFQSSGGSAGFLGFVVNKKDKAANVGFDDESNFEDASSVTATLGTQVTVLGGLLGIVILAYLASTI
jgi:hypothetical protein